MEEHTWRGRSLGPRSTSQDFEGHAQNSDVCRTLVRPRRPPSSEFTQQKLPEDKGAPKPGQRWSSDILVLLSLTLQSDGGAVCARAFH